MQERTASSENSFVKAQSKRFTLGNTCMTSSGHSQFYCVNTSYPMDNCFTGHCDRSSQTSEKDVLYIIPAGPVRRTHSPGGASYFLFLSRQCDVIASFSFGAWTVKTCFHDKRTSGSTPNSTALFHLLRRLEVFSTTMSSSGQRRGACGHAMAGFDSHSKCARCRDKGLGDDPCIQKKECDICRGFTPEQILQLATPTYRDRKEKTAMTTTSSTPTLMDPADVSVLGKVEKVKAVQSTPAKKTKCSESPKPSASKKKSSSSRPSAEDLKQLDDKWSERFSRLQAMLLAKTFTVPVEPVVKPASDVTPTQKPFLCQLTGQSADIMLSLCGVYVRVRVNNFFSKTTRPRDMLFFLKDTLSIEDEELFKACKSVCSSVC